LRRVSGKLQRRDRKTLGKIEQEEDGTVVLDVRGVGYELTVPLGTVGRLVRDAEGNVTLHVHTHAREDALVLFGLQPLTTAWRFAR
jgi:Holliday junction DNA helicase RuvA